MNQTSALKKKEPSTWSILGFPSLTTFLLNIAVIYLSATHMTSDCNFTLIPLYLLISNSLFIVTLLIRIVEIVAHDFISACRDGIMLGKYIETANLLILIWGTYVTFGYGDYDKWKLDQDSDFYCNKTVTLVALVNLILSWILLPIALFCECLGLIEGFHRRLRKASQRRRRTKADNVDNV